MLGGVATGLAGPAKGSSAMVPLMECVRGWLTVATRRMAGQVPARVPGRTAHCAPDFSAPQFIPGQTFAKEITGPSRNLAGTRAAGGGRDRPGPSGIGGRRAPPYAADGVHRSTGARTIRGIPQGSSLAPGRPHGLEPLVPGGGERPRRRTMRLAVLHAAGRRGPCSVAGPGRRTGAATFRVDDVVDAPARRVYPRVNVPAKPRHQSMEPAHAHVVHPGDGGPGPMDDRECPGAEQ